MTTRTAETTNGKLDQVATEIATLIDWAEADAEHAAENDAPETADDDLTRAQLLEEALALVSQCYR